MAVPPTRFLLQYNGTICLTALANQDLNPSSTRLSDVANHQPQSLCLSPSASPVVSQLHDVKVMRAGNMSLEGDD